MPWLSVGLGLFRSYGRATGFWGVLCAGFDHRHVGSCSNKEDQDERPHFQLLLIRIRPRWVIPAER